MNGLRFVEKLANSPWLCSPEHLEFMHGIFLRYLDRVASGEKLDVRAVEQAVGKPLDNTRSVTLKDGVARIPVEGTIVKRANLFSEISGGVSTEVLTRDFIAAYNDATVHSILFVFDTPGGEALGINELATLIREKRDLGEKRIEAFCDGMCASAGYYLASAVGRITAEPTSAVGSIGTVVRVFNPAAAGKSPYLDFVNARSPNKRPDPNTAAGRSAIQEWIDDMGDQFIRFVADSRGVSFEKVEKDFGQGFVMTGQRALDAGMIDALGTEGEVVGRLQEEGRAALRIARSSRPAALATGGAVAREPVGVLSGEHLVTRVPRNLIHAPDFEEVATEMSENATTEAKNGQGGNGAPAGEERRETGFMAHMRKFFVGEQEEAPSASARAEDERAEANDGTREDMTDRTEQTEASTEANLRAELEAERQKNADLRGQVEALMGRNAEAARALAEERVDAELSAYCGEGKDGGVPPWQAKAARPDLLEAAYEPNNEAAQQRAKRWRTVLDGARGTVQFGERGTAEGKLGSEMSDDEKVRATIAERGLDPAKDYGRVASELVAAGEIRRGALGASPEGEE